jgi:prolyl 4-hydroxylase
LYPSRASKLLCRYRHNNHPYLLWRPIKEEQLFDEPPIFLYHDIISDKDIHQIKSLAMPRVSQQLIRN